jgi:hypothetical protein
MAHKWLNSYDYRGSVRTCENCGAQQIYDLVSYDRMSGSTYRWRPLVGRCKPKKENDHARSNKRRQTKERSQGRAYALVPSV